MEFSGSSSNLPRNNHILASIPRQSISQSNIITNSRVGKRYYKITPPMQSIGLPYGRDNISKYSKASKKMKSLGMGKGIPAIDLCRPNTCA